MLGRDHRTVGGVVFVIAQTDAGKNSTEREGLREKSRT